MSQPEPVHVTVDSSLFSTVIYSADATLELVFRNGSIYRYFAVPPDVFQALLAAPSKGAYFNQHIRDHFPYQRLA